MTDEQKHEGDAANCEHLIELFPLHGSNQLPWRVMWLVIHFASPSLLFCGHFSSTWPYAVYFVVVISFLWFCLSLSLDRLGAWSRDQRAPSLIHLRPCFHASSILWAFTLLTVEIWWFGKLDWSLEMTSKCNTFFLSPLLPESLVACLDVRSLRGRSKNKWVHVANSAAGTLQQNVKLPSF